jgi:hypothetical protein
VNFTHQTRFGRTPYLVAADAAFYSGKNELDAKAKGVKRVCIPNRSTIMSVGRLTSAGFTALPTTAPDGWPSTIKWPNGGKASPTAPEIRT